MKRTPIKRRYTEEYVKELGNKLVKWINEPDNYWLGKFASENKMARPRLHEIASTNTEFNKVYEYAKQMQENKLVTGGMTGKFNVTMVIFSLKNVAEWRDRQEHEHKGFNIEIFNVQQTDNKNPNRRIQIQRT